MTMVLLKSVFYKSNEFITKEGLLRQKHDIRNLKCKLEKHIMKRTHEMMPRLKRFCNLCYLHDSIPRQYSLAV